MALAERENASFVGRRNELESILSGTFDRVSFRPSLIVISGPAGIGKTRLAQEASKIAESRGFTVVTVKCGRDSPFPYAPFRELAERLRRIPDSPSNPFADERTLSSKDGIMVVWESYLGELSRQRPVLVLLDDLQKADSCTVRLLDYLIRSNLKDGPRFIATVCMDDLALDEECRSTVGDLLSNASMDAMSRTVELVALSTEETVKMICGRFKLALPKELVDEVAKNSMGNPLSALESIRSVATAFTNEFHDGPFRAKEMFNVPMTWEEAVKLRLHTINETERHVLDRASAFPRGTDVFALARSMEARPDEVTKLIREVYKKTALIDCYGSQFRFPHERVRRLVQGLIPETDRQEVHRSVALGLQAEGYGEECLGELSRQWLLAGDRERCVGLSLLAGRICAVWGAHLESRLYFRRVIELLSVTERGDAILESYEGIGDSYVGTGRRSSALEWYDRAIKLSTSSDRARLLRKKSTCTKNLTSEKENDLSLSLVLQALIEAGDDYETAECKSSIAGALMAKGDMEGAENLCLAAMRTFKDQGALDRWSREMMQYGDLQLRQGKADQAIKTLTHAIRIAQEHPNFANQVDANEALGIAYLCKGQVEKAIPVFDHCMEISRRAGDRNRTEMIQFDKTFAFDLAGDIARAREIVVEASNESQKRGAGPAWQDVVMAHIEQREGDLATAERLADASLRTIEGETFGQPAIGTLAVAVKASVLSRKKEYTDANQLFQSVLPRFRGTRFGPLYEATVRAWFAESLAEQGRMEQAVDEYRKARSLFDGFGNSLSTNIIDSDIDTLSARMLASH